MGQAARSIPVWMEQTVSIAAEPTEVEVTAAVSLELEAAKAVDPLL